LTQFPAEGELLTFDTHIKPLFCERDRRSMLRAFELWSNEDLDRHSEAVLARLRSGAKPCGGAWSQEVDPDVWPGRADWLSPQLWEGATCRRRPHS
jgi:hypothetical protein